MGLELEFEARLGLDILGVRSWVRGKIGVWLTGTEELITALLVHRHF